MASHNIYDGGNRSNRVTNQMLPSGTNPVACNPPYHYADHQRTPSFAITKRIDLRPLVPFGGGGKDQSLRCYFQDNPVAVGDVLNTHLLLPNSVLLAVSYGIVSPVPGLTFSLSVPGAGLNVVSSVNAGVVPTNTAGCKLAVYLPVTNPAAYSVPGTGLFIDDADTLAMTITALPATGLLPDCGNAGLEMWITAHVIELDNGNA